ncbi:hypothetical protein D8B26_003775 [Coccidioides posadasii str. Silveira]|uniref:Uncharacterized protein n=3 Tax=Coccidioides posadasii TaxID=199306 RepID=E9D8U9_COCPS|nr:hypothetical protein CPC735_073330 [Coccidioides posadasii C735 delta SOWgp]EER29651.1 hypothetical protein CPC735_073330 [Coccidioides posadasii C735 delta SOWgp]EFW16983.1 hypothetical protein CPSG_06251 [Coccidioides posadasii str. Silveira]KMM69899.1 DUF895 domain-containing protein [Coccidioides posadasii RMSCC 3488]QVM09109.1 hypothetical protein D8B26_003775 [Coccidioides posadasii str. Silveira]|eukprot:XP_003071796.1 hypothetical protein CPC735_073330 [Coccidioides posadasii C735 delta SOWgp]
MPGADEKRPPSSASTPPLEDVEGHHAPTTREGRPWMYKSPKIGPLTLPWYASPISQLLIVSFVCFLCPGMFNAVNGLGGAGQVDPSDVNKANTALYSTFAVVGFFAGSIANRLGLRTALFFGGFGYFLYVASILSYNHNGNVGFLIFAGALLGVCAGCLWTAQGAIMMSYPEEKSKGKFISWFWIIFNLGGVIGSLVPLGQNIHSKANAVNDGTYIAFMVLMFLGFILAFTLVDPKYVRRADGSHVILMKNPSWKSELLGLLEVARTDYYIVLYFPMFIASNWFTTYQFNAVNLAKFNIRTRALNNVLYWLFQMVGAFVFGYLLDLKVVRRTVRARAGLVLLFALTMAVWGGGWAFQKDYDRADINDHTPRMDWQDNSYIGPMFLYLFYGFYDAAFQTCCYWFMGSLTNNGRKLAHFAAFYKGIQSAGAAITWRLDDLHISYKVYFGSTWGLLAGSLVVAAPVIFWKIKDTIDLEDDLKFSDDTIEEVAATHVLEERHEK